MSDLSLSCEQKRTLQRPLFSATFAVLFELFSKPTRSPLQTHHTYELSFEAASAIHAAAAPELIAPVNPPEPANEEAR